MSKPDSWMPIYWSDYWADTGGLSASQHGAYLNLIGRYWRERGLPNDDAYLQRASTMSEKEWRSNKSIIMRFFSVEGEKLRHKRIDLEIERSERRYSAKVEAGTKGAQKRWHSHSTANGTANSKQDGTAIAEGMPNGCTTHNSHFSNKELEKGFLEVSESDFDEWYKTYPHKIAKAQSRKAFAVARAKVDQQTLMEATKRYVETKPSDVAWCNPANWLNGERWNDAPALTEQPKTVQTVDFERSKWEARCKGWSERKFWNRDMWGPEPDAAGFRGPRDLVAQSPLPEFLERNAS